MNRQAVTLRDMESVATYTGMGCLGEIARGTGTVYLFDMLSNKHHTNSEE